VDIIEQITDSLPKKGINAKDVKEIITWVRYLGGIKSLTLRFEIAGLGLIMDSWLSKKQNSAISSEQIQDVFGMVDLYSLATSIGRTLAGTADMLASSLPVVIEHINAASVLKKQQRRFPIVLKTFMSKMFT